MRSIRGFSNFVLSACLVVTNGTHVFAGDGEKATAKAKPGPMGAPEEEDRPHATYGAPYNVKITEYQNELGQTVYSIAASHFDVSPPLLEMAATAESSNDLQLPASRLVCSANAPLAAPTLGFNFAGVPMNSAISSDSNGSVGNNQFVEVVNNRYQVWSLNRSTQVATSILGPAALGTLWAGFGGDCETVSSYSFADPIVLYDKIANRWLIAQFGISVPGLCVALSTSPDATGTYARYAFGLPFGLYVDYEKLGVWTDAYYMWSLTGGDFAFAAMDRAKMLAANPAATWQVIRDGSTSKPMPADLDGFALPPTRAPGIFVWFLQNKLHIGRMKVNFTTPSLTTLTTQAIVPVAPIINTGDPNGFSGVIPQPGTTRLVSSMTDYVMFRAAYRNYIDHESLVVSRTVDPSVSGVIAGVRWHDIRLSGTPNATCPTYPCVYQEGTIADVANGRSRWLPSIAMDSAENILVGYTTSGKTDGVENHSQRYTGRAKGDPPGLMTVPETTIVTGTANQTISRLWGDYASMSIDPADDCTFWYVSQYFTTQNSWSTRIASAVFPAGSGAGQCQPSTCTARPTGVPVIGTATVPGLNQITVTWTGITPTPGAYAIERAEGVCGAEGLYRPLAATAGTPTSFTDTTVMGGVRYAYKVRAAADASGRCQAQQASLGCAGATATGQCTLKPTFAGASGAASNQGTNCGVTVSWAHATSRCPLTPNVRYTIFRSSAPDFVPSTANRIATCVAGPSSYLDTDNLQSGTTYYYVVRAEDGSTGNGGACGGGNEEANGVVVSATPYAAGMQTAPGTWSDGGGDGSAFLLLDVRSSQAGFPAWNLVKTADDPGANHTPGGGYAYRNAGPAAGDTYAPNICAEMPTPSLTIAAATVNLKYWERHQLEYHRDAVAVEYSVNDGPWDDVPAPSNNAADLCDASDDTTGWEPLSCAGITSNNVCSFADTKLVFSGPLGGGDSCANFATSAGVTPYAHRCHQITGLTTDDTIRFRWQSSSDEDSNYAGFYLDDVAVTNVRLPNVCAPDTCSGQVDGTACSDGNACTSGDSCGGGRCNAGSSSSPVETTNVSAASDKATYSWSAAVFATGYDVVRGSLGALPVGPGDGDEICFDDLLSPTLVDTDVPASGTGYWYLSRGENACGIGTFGTRSNGSPRTTTTCP